MKKILFAFAAFAALVACQKVEEKAPVAAARYSFNITVDGTNGFGGAATKAVKTGWEAGDRVYVFFKEGEALLSDIYAEMTFDGAKWSTVQRGDGSLGEAGVLTAVYVPFVDASLRPEFAYGKWTIDGGDVYFTQASNVPYTVSSNTVNATINMALAEGYVQFYITGVAANELLTCDKIDAYDTITVGADMTVSSVKKGAGMLGRAYKDGVVFYGKYNGGNAPLTVLTLTNGGTVYKMMKAKAVEANKAYSLGAFAADPTTWIAVPDMLPGLYSVAPGKQVRFSKSNLYYDADSNSYKFEASPFETGAIDLGGLGMLTPGHTSYFFWSADATVAMTEPYNDAAATANDKLFVNADSRLTINGESWYNLTGDEWNYLLKDRNQDTYYVGKVNNSTVSIIVPDDVVWVESAFGTQPSNEEEGADYSLYASIVNPAIIPANGFYWPDLVGLPYALAIGSGVYLWSASTRGDATGAVAIAIAYESGSAKCNVQMESRAMAAGIRLVTDPQYNPTANL